MLVLIWLDLPTDSLRIEGRCNKLKLINNNNKKKERDAQRHPNIMIKPLLISSLLLSPIALANYEPVSLGEGAAQIGANALGMVAFSVVGGVIGLTFTSCEPDELLCGLNELLAGSVIGANVGTTVATSLTGHYFERDGKWWYAAAGSAAGTLAALAMINVAENTGNYNNFVEISAITLPAIGAITGYYTSDYFAAAPYVDTQSEKVGVAFQLQF